MAHAREASTSSNTPVLIHPTATAPPLKTSSSSANLNNGIRLKYPYPLVLLSLFDLLYSTQASIRWQLSGLFLPLAICRAIGSLILVGCSKRWRSKGGFVAAGSGLTLLGVVWEVCRSRLEFSKGDIPVSSSPASFLICTAATVIMEYLLFLFLLRLSPPSHRLNPLSMRLPYSAVQNPTAFPYQSTIDESFMVHHRPESPVSPTRNRHFRQASQRTMRTMTTATDNEDEQDSPDENRHSEEEDLDEDEGSDISSISESSIIDLPPARLPARIIPPTSLSLNNGLVDLAKMEQSPVLGPLIRRTKSSRFIASSWGRSAASSPRDNTYGTFGIREGDTNT